MDIIQKTPSLMDRYLKVRNKYPIDGDIIRLNNLIAKFENASTDLEKNELRLMVEDACEEWLKEHNELISE